MHERSRLFGYLGTVTAGVLVAACGKKPAPPPAPGPPQVSVMQLRPQSVVLRTELPGRTTPYMVSEIRPQIGGLVKTKQFREGSNVKAGDLLYVIEPAAFQASVANAQATLNRAEASLVSTRLRSDRYRELLTIQAVSKQDADDADAALGQGQADVSAARAMLETQRINLAWTRITAPISGRIGRSTVTQGALVGANQATALATVQRLDPIYVDMTQSSDTFLRLKRELVAGTLATDGANVAKVSLLLADGTPYRLKGVLQFSDVTVDTGSNAVTLRAVFPNPRNELLPGLYVRAVIEEGVKPAALLVPQPAVARNDAGKPIAYVLTADSKLEQRTLVTDRAIGNQWLVASGLKAGEQVVVEGLQGAKAGVTVKVVAAAASAASAGGASTAARPPGAASAGAPADVPAAKN